MGSKGKTMMEVRLIGEREPVAPLEESSDGVTMVQGAFSQEMPSYATTEGVLSFFPIATEEEIELHNEAWELRDEERERVKPDISQKDYDDYYKNHPLKDYYPKDKKDLCTGEIPLAVGNRYFKNLAVGEPYTWSMDDIYMDEEGLNTKKREDFFATIKNLNSQGYKSLPTILGVYKNFETTPNERPIAPVYCFNTAFLLHPMDINGRDEDGYLITTVYDDIKKVSSDGIFVLDPETFFEGDDNHGYGFYMDAVLNMSGVLDEDATEDFKIKTWKSICETEYLSSDIIRDYAEYMDWDSVSKDQELDEDFIEELDTQGYPIDWDNIAKSQKLSSSFIDNHADKLNFKILSEYQILSEDTIIKYKDKVDFDNIIKTHKLSIETILVCEQYIQNWNDAVYYQSITKDLAKKHSKDINWIMVCANNNVTEDFIESKSDIIDWSAVCSITKLSEPFIEKYKYKVDWKKVSSSQTLSEDFIRKFQDKVSWIEISISQYLSEEFIIEFKNKVAWDKLLANQKHLSDEFKQANKKKLGIKENNVPSIPDDLLYIK